jgi:serine/threonine-protein kinase
MLQRLGKYEIVGKIGQGAMGEVYRAHDPILNRDVAIKTMSAAIGADDDLRKRFLREAQSAARLNHPNIITVFDFGEEQGKIYMAMELLEGQDLKDMIGRHTPMSLDQKVSLKEQICDGLAFAHTKEVIHRDLKPANIHVQPNGQIKIMDFGLAKLSSSDMTRAGVIMGTPNYMSPEQVRGEKADSRSDVFSLGAVFYELLANRKPFDAETLHAILFQVMQNEPDPIWQLVPDIPPALAQAIDRAMAKDPAQRYRDAGEFREALRTVRSALMTGGTIAPAPMEAAVDRTILTPMPSGADAPAAPRAPTMPPPPQRFPATPIPGGPMTPLPGAYMTPIPGAPMAGRGPGTPIPGGGPGTPIPPSPFFGGGPGTPIPGPLTPIPRTAPPTPLPTTPLPVVVQPPFPRSAPPTPLPTTMLPPMPRPSPQAPVEGAMALEANRRPYEPSRMPPTLSGQAPTQAPPAAAAATRPAAGGAPAWRIPVIAGAALAVIIGSVVVYRMTRPEAPAESPSASPTEDPRAKELAAQVQSAKKSFDDKDYKTAATQAGEVLQKDPGNAEAKQVLDGAQGALREVEEAVKTGRAALEHADTQTASAALSKLLSLDPKNPAAAEFSARLNSAFRGQAEAAQKTMRVAQKEALGAKAGSEAEYASAVAMAKEADGLFTKGEFAVAARKFVEARDGFERARRTKQAHGISPTSAPATPMPATPMPATPAPTPASTPPPTPAATPVPADVDQSVIRRLVGDYKRAIETKDVGLYKTLNPGASGSDEKAIRGSQSQNVDINVLSIQVDGDKATVMVSRRDTAADGKTYSMQQTLVLSKSGKGWIIKKIHTQLIGQ